MTNVTNVNRPAYGGGYRPGSPPGGWGGGYLENAGDILKQVVTIQPQDRLSAQLLEALTPASHPQPVPNQATTPTAVAAVPPAQPPSAAAEPSPGPGMPTGPLPSKFIGSWNASPANQVTISLSLDKGNGFSWKVTDRGQVREFRGFATFDHDILALTPPDQPPMVGKVTWRDDTHFQFRALGAPGDDPGLIFGQ